MREWSRCCVLSTLERAKADRGSLEYRWQLMGGVMTGILDFGLFMWGINFPSLHKSPLNAENIWQTYRYSEERSSRTQRARMDL